MGVQSLYTLVTLSYNNMGGLKTQIKYSVFDGYLKAIVQTLPIQLNAFRQHSTVFHVAGWKTVSKNLAGTRMYPKTLVGQSLTLQKHNRASLAL